MVVRTVSSSSGLTTELALLGCVPTTLHDVAMLGMCITILDLKYKK